jgi:hypothetical protein
LAALSLLDLARAAPTCRDFRAAYQARVSAAHPAAVEKAVSGLGDAFLKSHVTLVLRLAMGLDLFSGGRFLGRDSDSRYLGSAFYIHGDGTLAEMLPGEYRPEVCLARVSHDALCHGDHAFAVDRITKPKCISLRIWSGIWRVMGPGFPRTRGSDEVRITWWCQASDCQEAAGELAALCRYVQAEQERCGEAFKLTAEFIIGSSRAFVNVGFPSELDLDGIAAALLPLSQLVRIRLWTWSTSSSRGHCVQLPSLGKLQAMCPAPGMRELFVPSRGKRRSTCRASRMRANLLRSLGEPKAKRRA